MRVYIYHFSEWLVFVLLLLVDTIYYYIIIIIIINLLLFVSFLITYRSRSRSK